MAPKQYNMHNDKPCDIQRHNARNYLAQILNLQPKVQSQFIGCGCCAFTYEVINQCNLDIRKDADNNKKQTNTK